MTIYKSKYQRYQGTLEPASNRWWLITEMELRRLLRQKWVRRFLIMAWMPTIVLMVMLYGSIVLKSLANFDGLDGTVFVYLFKTETWVITVMMAAFGSDLIAKDIHSRSISLYFTRPLNATQYMWGKFATVALLILSVTLLPGIVLATAQLVMDTSPDWVRYMQALWRITANACVTAFVASSLILLLSSTGAQPRTIGTVWVGIFFLLEIARGALTQAVGPEPILDLISLLRMFYGVSELLFDGRTEHLAALVTLLLVSCTCFSALHYRLRRLEKNV